MTDAGDHDLLFGPDEGELAAAEGLGARRRDVELAAELGRPQPRGATPSAGYLHDLDTRPRVPASREAELVARAQRGDAAARAELIEALLPLVASVARIYRGSASIDRVELLQEGVVGLLRALERYEPERGVPFWAYAAWWVRQAMQQLVAELNNPVVLSDRALRQLARLKDTHRAALVALGREPTYAELAARSGLQRDHVDDLVAATGPRRSLDEPVGGEHGQIGALGELIADPIAEDEYERVLNEIEIEQTLSLLSGLSGRERAIVRARFGLGGPERSLREIAAELGLSAERVRQIEQRALGKLAAAAGVDAPLRS
jgi:RNA polymerase primary sigma factor